MNKHVRKLNCALALGALLVLAGCGGGTGDNSNGGKAFNNSSGQGTSTGTTGGTTTGTTTTPTVTSPTPTLGAGCANSGTDIICVTIGASAASLLADAASSSVMTATLTRNGAALSTQILDFSISDATLGSLTQTTAVTLGGTATTTFTAARKIGAVAVAVKHTPSGATNTVVLALTQAPGNTPAGIQFVTASQSVLGILGSGQPTTSSVIFKVTDSGGLAVPNQAVNFSMVGPTGAYIGSVDGTPQTATGTTNAAGEVSVPLNAGNVAGPVTITAGVTVSGQTFSSSTSVISIGGGVPSARHLSIATEKFNLPGLVYFGAENQITVLVADRFSNYNILEGTQVSFFTEAGAIDRSVSLNNTGSGVVKLRTQLPLPYPVAATHPRYPNALGWVTVIAVTRGEEEFADVNGNGVYDAGIDTFTTAMDLDEPFVDSNDNGLWDGPGCTQALCDATHPGELFVDVNQNGRWDPKNGVWDGPGCSQAGCTASPTIWKSMLLQFTGDVICSVAPQTGWVVPNGGSLDFTITIRDVNNNVPVSGVTLSGVAMNNSSGARTDIGTGNLSMAMTDGISTAPFTYTFTLADNSALLSNDATGFRISVLAPADGRVRTCTDLTGSGIVQ
jgi:hypothetical protein